MSGNRASVWPIAIWNDGQWLEAARDSWPDGRTEHVIVEVEPALGVLNVGTIVLGAEAHDELERARAGDFGEDPRDAWLVIGIRSELSRAAAKRKRPPPRCANEKCRHELDDHQAPGAECVRIGCTCSSYQG